uniref:Uncharacterized protein n=1 Tax=Arion vulgaris TaxID=1028688 RepID=A0A0B7AP11_9EUPU
MPFSMASSKKASNSKPHSVPSGPQVINISGHQLTLVDQFHSSGDYVSKWKFQMRH